ncbi:MAG: endonuclease/exonuclease/phosphatase family protein [Roseburia sp.]
MIKISADIICLQEVPNKAAHQDLVERCRYQFAVFHEHANEEEGLSILSRYSIKSFEYDQNCIFAKIEIQNKTLLLINTHLPWDSAVNRELVVLNVMEKIEGISADYVIFLGDFNCSERSGVNQFLLGEMTLKGRDCGKNWYDLAEAYAERHNIATDNTLDIKSNPRWKGLKSIEVSRRYDRILVRNTYPMDLPILEKCETFGRTISEKSGYAASDHYGVYADLYFI